MKESKPLDELQAVGLLGQIREPVAGVREVPLKRGRGRPRKAPLRTIIGADGCPTSPSTAQPKASLHTPKQPQLSDYGPTTRRPRGRPRKNPLPDGGKALKRTWHEIAATSEANTSTANPEQPPIKRRRGRPPKNRPIQVLEVPVVFRNFAKEDEEDSCTDIFKATPETTFHDLLRDAALRWDEDPHAVELRDVQGKPLLLTARIGDSIPMVDSGIYLVGKGEGSVMDSADEPTSDTETPNTPVSNNDYSCLMPTKKEDKSVPAEPWWVKLYSFEELCIY